MDPLQLLSNFVASYYYILIKNPDDMVKFYSKEAQISRDSYVQKIAEKQEFFPKIQPSDELSILDYHGLPITNGFNIIVNGILKIGNELNYFIHQFTLQQKSQRYFIVGDNLTFLPTYMSSTEYNEVIKDLNVQTLSKSKKNY